MNATSQCRSPSGIQCVAHLSLGAALAELSLHSLQTRLVLLLAGEQATCAVARHELPRQREVIVDLQTELGLAE